MTENSELQRKCLEHGRDAEVYCDHCEVLLCPQCVVDHQAPPHHQSHLKKNKEEIIQKFNERIDVYKQFKERLDQKLSEMQSGEFLQDFLKLAVQVREQLADIESTTVVPLISFQYEQDKISIEWIGRAGVLKNKLDKTNTEWAKEKKISNTNIMKFKALQQEIKEISQIIEICPEFLKNPLVPNQAELAGQLLMKILKMVKVTNCVPWRAATYKTTDFKEFGTFLKLAQLPLSSIIKSKFFIFSYRLH